MDLDLFESRKRDHIHLALSPENQALGGTGLEQVHLHHDALPELDFAEITLQSIRLGRPSETPFYISGMTAGHEDAIWVNSVLATSAQDRGWAMGVGSQRRELGHATGSESPDRWKEFRDRFPRLALFANLGITQVIRSQTDEIARVVDSLRANALVIHTNVLQECLQPEGTPSFKGALASLELLCKKLPVPIILKETGCGFSKATLSRLGSVGLAAIDISGFGGTHWGRIEGARAQAGSPQSSASAVFAQWGESTVSSLQAAIEVLPSVEAWASGGVRTGLDAAKLIAIGATQVGFAQPALQAVMKAERSRAEGALSAWMSQVEFELRVALMCTGSRTPSALRGRVGSWKVQP